MADAECVVCRLRREAWFSAAWKGLLAMGPPSEPQSAILQRIVGYVIVVAVIGVIIQFGGRAALLLTDEGRWAYLWRYNSESGLGDLSLGDITVQPKPHDCEFLSAPMGAKHCHYEAQVVTLRVKPRARLVSKDEGHTWENAPDPIPRPYLVVIWDKRQD